MKLDKVCAHCPVDANWYGKSLVREDGITLCTDHARMNEKGITLRVENEISEE